MNILRSYKRTKLFLWINIIGLAIGLAVSIMLVLFVVNELSYDKHFANHERIVRLVTVSEEEGNKNNYGINLRKAYTELPGKVPGIEAVVQIYGLPGTDVTRKPEHFQDIDVFYADPEFFKIFQMKFIEGTPESALVDNNSVVITREQADAIFGGIDKAMGQTLEFEFTERKEFTVSAIVENLPSNTHFDFDIIVPMPAMGKFLEYLQGLEFYTYYLIGPDASQEDVRSALEKEYTETLKPWADHFNANAYGVTENITDIYLKTIADNNIGKKSNMSFVWLLSGLALFILLLAITNFINLFIAQGETRMNEIGIRKANGARMQDIVGQFFKEVFLIVFISFIIGFILTIIFTPSFSLLIDKDIDLIQLLNPWFIICILLLFVITVILSASYPSFYLSRFNPLEILAKRIKFSKRRLTVIVVVFQSVITIVLMSYILVINEQTKYLENLPIGYNPQNVLSIRCNNNIISSYDALKQELLTSPEIQMVSGAGHIIGKGTSGQGIGLLDNKEAVYSIDEYRIMAGLCELVQFELVEGEFYKENAPDSIKQVLLNEAAIKMLGFDYPAVGRFVDYKGTSQIIGVVKDFRYMDPAAGINPLVLSRVPYPRNIYIRFNENVNKGRAQEIAHNAFRKFDSDFVINPIWLDDVYNEKFNTIQTQSRILFVASLLSIFIAMMGLVAIHLYTTVRRTKEIGIRKVQGAASRDIFVLLTKDIVKWIAIAGIFAIPIAYYITSNWLNNYENRVSLGWEEFVIPIAVQCVVAVIVTSVITFKAIIQNPVDALKSE